MKITSTHKAIVAALLLAPLAMYADAGGDVLKVATDTLTAQMKGSGKTLIYAVEGVAAIATYYNTRNWVSLTGIGAIFVFTTALFAVI